SRGDKAGLQVCGRTRVSDNDRQIKRVSGGDHESFRPVLPCDAARIEIDPEYIGCLDRLHLPDRECETVAQLTERAGIRAAAHENPRHVAEAYFADNLELFQAVVIRPECEVFLARTRHGDGRLPCGTA